MVRSPFFNFYFVFCRSSSFETFPLLLVGYFLTIHSSNRFAIGYTCCFINGVAICWLWRLRRDDPKWLFANLFFAGLVNAFSGLISTFVNCFSAQGGAWGSSTESTVILASVVTFIYAVLTVVYYRKSLQARRRRSGKPGVSSAMV